MEFVFTKHAKKRIYERGIKQEEIKNTIEFPDYTIKRGKEIEAYKKINERFLKVVYINIGKFKKIITLYYIQ